MRSRFANVHSVYFLFTRERKASRNGALRTLDFAMTGDEGKENCQKMVDILGLRTIFPLFIKPPKGSKRSGETRAENEGKKLDRSFLISFRFFDHQSMSFLVWLH